MAKSQIIHTDGEDLIVITRSDYEALLARAGDDASEDAMTLRIVEATGAKIARARCRAALRCVGCDREWRATTARYGNSVASHKSTSPRKRAFGKAISRTSKPARRGALPPRSRPLQPRLECRSMFSWDDTAP